MLDNCITLYLLARHGNESRTDAFRSILICLVWFPFYGCKKGLFFIVARVQDINTTARHPNY